MVQICARLYVFFAISTPGLANTSTCALKCMAEETLTVATYSNKLNMTLDQLLLLTHHMHSHTSQSVDFILEDFGLHE